MRERMTRRKVIADNTQIFRSRQSGEYPNCYTVFTCSWDWCSRNSKKNPAPATSRYSGARGEGRGRVAPPMSGGSFVWRKAFSFGGLKIGEEGGKDANGREV